MTHGVNLCVDFYNGGKGVSFWPQCGQAVLVEKYLFWVLRVHTVCSSCSLQSRDWGLWAGAAGLRRVRAVRRPPYPFGDAVDAKE